MQRTFRIFIVLFIGVDLLLAFRYAWGAAIPYRAGLTASGVCPVAGRLRSVDAALRLVAKRNYYEQTIRIKRRDGGLDLWQTPDGDIWMPEGDDMLPFILAEQALRIYGDSTQGVHPGDIVLDCGANVGMFTRTALRAGASRVVAIEPAPANLECLRRNLAGEIAQGRVIVYPKGVWDHDDFMTLAVDPHNAGADSMVLRVKGETQVRVPVTTIDKMVAELKLPRVNFIKMDIEGAEKNALRGARDTLQSQPRMAISPEHLPDDTTAIPQLVRTLRPAYRLECGSCIYYDGAVRPQALLFY